jgi:hypothetical protein
VALPELRNFVAVILSFLFFAIIVRRFQGGGKRLAASKRIFLSPSSDKYCGLFGARRHLPDLIELVQF